VRVSTESVLDFLSNESVQGELLADRLARGPLSAADALQLGAAIGAALSRLHAQAQVHGCLSPHVIAIGGANVRILQCDAASRERALAYRSPEQIRGEAPDWRSDIFSFGEILREIAPAADSSLAPVIVDCTRPDPAQRRQRVQNAVIDLKLARRKLSPPPVRRPAPAVPETRAPDPPPPQRNLVRTWLIVGLALLALSATAAAAILYLRHQAAPVRKFEEAAPDHTSYPGTPAVAPDGSSLAFSAVGSDGQRMLWLRTFDEVPARVIPGTEGGIAPFWSPDGQYLGFFAHNALMKVRVRQDSGEAKPELLYAADFEPGGGTWNRDGTILFAPNLSDGIYRVSSKGGDFAPVLKLQRDKGQAADLWPQFLPDGRSFLYFCSTGKPETTGVYAAAADGSRTQFLLRSTTNAVYSPGYLLYMRDRDLMVQPFNASKLQLDGEPTVLATDIGAIETLSLAPISVSANGILVYQAVAKASRHLVWMDRAGKTLATAGDNGEWATPRIAPDGVRAAAAKQEKDGPGKIWIFGNSGPPTVFESGLATAVDSPVWSPDGSRIAFSALHEGVEDLYVKAVNGAARAELVHASSFKKYPVDWSRDGKWLLFVEHTIDTIDDLWTASLWDRRATAILNTVHSESYATLSPDRKWLACQTDISGRYEVVVQPWDAGAPGAKRQWQISHAGGGLPHWRADGSELFYITSTGALMSVQLHKSEGEFAFDPPVQLFQTRTVGKRWNPYDASPDGQRFLVNLPVEWSNSALITITNWTEKLAQNQK
jgi:eukaryotic-like serine/threonine-protein kinase